MSLTTTNATPTMSIREIADLTDTRDVRVLLEALNADLPTFGGTYTDGPWEEKFGSAE